MMQSVESHLLYASIVWIAAWLLTSMQRGTATTKYWIWVVTSANFLLPLGALPARLWGDPIADVTELERVRFVMKDGEVVRNDLGRRIDSHSIRSTAPLFKL